MNDSTPIQASIPTDNLIMTPRVPEDAPEHIRALVRRGQEDGPVRDEDLSDEDIIAMLNFAKLIPAQPVMERVELKNRGVVEREISSTNAFQFFFNTESNYARMSSTVAGYRGINKVEYWSKEEETKEDSDVLYIPASRNETLHVQYSLSKETVDLIAELLKEIPSTNDRSKALDEILKQHFRGLNERKRVLFTSKSGPLKRKDFSDFRFIGALLIHKHLWIFEGAELITYLGKCSTRLAHVPR